MKLCDCTLKQWIEKRNDKLINNNMTDFKIDEELNLSIFRQILEGVQYIHSKGIIHRDLKVQVIFLL